MEHGRAFAFTIYLVAFVTGAIVMSFEMLGSRYLNPYFGSGIYTWASLISTVLAALCAGYFLGGIAADRHPSARVLGATVLIGSAYLLCLPVFAQNLLEAVLAAVDDVKQRQPRGGFRDPVLSGDVPRHVFAVRHPAAAALGAALRRACPARSTASRPRARIVGTLGTTFLLIPAIGTRAITITLGLAGLASGLLLVFLPALRRRADR